MKNSTLLISLGKTFWKMWNIHSGFKGQFTIKEIKQNFKDQKYFTTSICFLIIDTFKQLMYQTLLSFCDDLNSFTCFISNVWVNDNLQRIIFFNIPSLKIKKWPITLKTICLFYTWLIFQIYLNFPDWWIYDRVRTSYVSFPCDMLFLAMVICVVI